MTRHHRQQQPGDRRSSSSGGNQGQMPPSPPLRSKPLGEMTTGELVNWLMEASGALADFSTYVQQYLDRRAGQQQRSGRPATYTDERYQQFQGLAADLISGLDEWRELIEREAATRKKQEEE